MPFITDPTWTPTRYRRAHAAWQVNSPTRDSDVLPRQAEATGTPRHRKLSGKLRNLLTWRAMNRKEGWTDIVANDNVEPDGRAAPVPVDSILEQRPTEGEMKAALEGVEFAERRHARLGGGGLPHVIAVGGDIERGRPRNQGRRRLPDCIVRMGKLHFSTGAVEEHALVLQAGMVVPGRVRIELGGLTRVGKHRPADYFGDARGAADNDNAPTVGKSDNCNPGAVDFVDPVADKQHAAWIRNAVGNQTADILDLALVAANFRQVGEHLGAAGKHAERRGRQAVIDACAALDRALAA